MRLRVAKHKQTIHTPKTLCPVARHYNEVGHGCHSSLKVIGIESIPCTIRAGNRMKGILQHETFLDIYTLKGTRLLG